ncbi:MAG: molybdate ABC transporter substrate-binding protein [Mariprofundus sp.]|nr:molybdate ABC transporter substrate-binding protein [Mariprofundus sp.]
MKLKICIFWLCLCFFGFSAYAQETITVAVASSLYPALQQRAEAFEQEYNVSIRLVSGSTGRLYNQILHGAPFDVFIAADEQRPALLMQQGKAVEQYDLGQGYLGVLRGHEQITGLHQLTDPSIRHIAIANPDVAPFGQAGKIVLQQQGLWHQLKHKFVYAQNAMQAKMMVNKGLVDAGFVPVKSSGQSIAQIQYYGLILADRDVARQWLNSLVQQHSVASR